MRSRSNEESMTDDSTGPEPLDLKFQKDDWFSTYFLVIASRRQHNFQPMVIDNEQVLKCAKGAHCSLSLSLSSLRVNLTTRTAFNG